MRRMLISRISRRVLVEHHRGALPYSELLFLLLMFRAALTQIWHQRAAADPGSRVGIIFTGLNVRKSVERCVNLLRSQGSNEPEVIIEGHVDMTFRYIPEHLELALHSSTV